jgi:hypothetical protein
MSPPKFWTVSAQEGGRTMIFTLTMMIEINRLGRTGG